MKFLFDISMLERSFYVREDFFIYGSVEGVFFFVGVLGFGSFVCLWFGVGLVIVVFCSGVF